MTQFASHRVAATIGVGALVATTMAWGLGTPASADAAGVAGRAVASHAPAATSAQQTRPDPRSAAIIAAIKASPLLGAVKRADISVTRIRTASADPRWASALVTPAHEQTDPAQVVLHQVRGRWSVRELGTAGVGCGLVTTAVRSQLRLWGPCPG